MEPTRPDTTPPCRVRRGRPKDEVLYDFSESLSKCKTQIEACKDFTVACSDWGPALWYQSRGSYIVIPEQYGKWSCILQKLCRVSEGGTLTP